MTITPFELGLYAYALFILFLTPGPVWLALAARTLSGGYGAAWPLALGVTVGDALWPLIAMLGVSWLVAQFDGFLTVLRLIGAVMFLIMGTLIIRNADHKISSDSRLTRPGKWAGFAAGVAVILGNPKAILFYMAILPGFFDLTRMTGWDIAAIMGISMLVPLIGNLIFAALISRAKRFLTSGTALKRVNIVAGSLMICVGLIIPFV
ncbi:LysE family translocator [Pseudooceanicola spongiae]|uniref:LysE family translocator n=1 Tax=Pseudooceanicola spongiae TaxID=2613965 RepID=A0A7L9WNE7_9RHOB|nr:LysE family translocator [Pseudooceanicola spongiae]QOL81911.1 LysE family translocator [Pseudooceanicola spongiae]